MATYYWVGGAGTWSSTGTTNWSLSSGGSGGAGYPTSTDDVIFDVNSDAGSNFSVSIGSSPNCRNFTIASGADLPDKVITFNYGNIFIYGNITLQNTANLNVSNTIFYCTGSGTNTITTNGKSYANMTVAGSGSWTLQDSLTTTSSEYFEHQQGTFNTNNFNVTVGRYLASSANAKTLNLGSSTVTISGGSGWQAVSSLTLNAGTSTVIISASSGLFYPNSKTYNNVSFSSTSSNNTHYIYESGTYANLTITGPSSDGARYVIWSANQTVTGTLTMSGTSAVRRIVNQSSTFDTARTLTVNAIAAMSDVDFDDITIAGAAAPISGTRLGNGGNTSGITFDAGVGKYWNLAGTNNVTAAGWALTAGGSPSVNNFPLAQDTIYLTNTGAFTTLTIGHNWLWGDLDASARTNAGNLNFSSNGNYFKNFTLGTGITCGGSYGRMLVRARNGTTSVITSNGINAPVLDTLAQGTGVVQLADNYTTTATGVNMYHYGGIFDINGKTLTHTSSYRQGNTSSKEIRMGANGKIIANCRGSGTEYPLYFNFTNCTITGSKWFEFTPASPTSTVSIVLSGQTADQVNQAPNIYFSTSSMTLGFSGYADNISTQGYTGTSNVFAGNQFYGDVTIGSGHTPSSSTSATTHKPPTATTKTFTSNGRTLNTPLTINGAGTLRLADALTLGAAGTASRALTLTAGTFDTQGFNVATSNVTNTGSSTRVLTLGSSTVTCSGASTQWSTSGSGVTVNASSSTIVLTNSGTSVVFYGGGFTYGTLSFAGSGNGAAYDFQIYDSNSFATWTNASRSGIATAIDFGTSGSTTTIRTSFPMSGSSGFLTRLYRWTDTGSWNINYTGAGTISVDYMNIARSNATPNTLTWYAGANSTNGGNNTGWIFTAPPVASSGNFLMFFIR